MALLITRRPEKNLSGKVSRWTAVHNPYIFEFTRKDYTVVNTLVYPAYHATYPTVKTNDSSIGTFISSGDTIYLNSGIYNGTYTVHAVSGEYVTIATDYIGVGGGGYLNAVEVLENYKLFINVYDGAGQLLDTIYPKPDSTGLSLVDVSGLIRSQIVTEQACDFININQAEDTLSGAFSIGYGASFTFNDTDITNTETLDDFTYYWLSAARQVDGRNVLGMAGHGQNMGYYVPFNYLVDSNALFLTMFEKPTMWVGYPFSLSFIYSEDFEDVYLDRHQINYDINRNATSAETSSVLYSNQQKYANCLMMDGTDTNTMQLDVWLETGDAIPAGGGYVQVGGLVTGSTSEYSSEFTGE